MLEILTTEQEKYYVFYDSVKQMLERTADRTLDSYQNSLEGDGYGLVAFLKSTILLFFGGIFLVILKMYILFRHLNYVIFVILFYWSRLVFGQSRRNVHSRNHQQDLHEDD